MSSSKPSPYDSALDALARALLLQALEAEGGNRSRAARRLGIPHRRLMREIDRLAMRDEVGIGPSPAAMAKGA